MGARPRAGLTILIFLAVLAALALWLLRGSTGTEGLGSSKTLLSLNGEDNYEPHPYFVQLVNASSGAPFCGGVLIAPNVVLTAAHCVENKKFDQIYCTIGDDNVAKDEEIEYRYIKKIIIHDRYQGAAELVKGNLNNYDVALLVLDSPVTTKPLCPLATQAMIPDTDLIEFDVKSIGRGYTNRDVPPYTEYTSFAELGQLYDYITASLDLKLRFPDKLQALFPPVVTNMHPKRDRSSFLVRYKGSVGFQGDSGGPLLFKIDGKWHVAGVLSTFIPDNIDTKADTPDKRWNNTYASVPFHGAWIDQTLAQARAGTTADAGVTVHEIAHVVALTRLKHLKTLAGKKGFEDFFFAGEKRWLDLAEFLKDASKYASLPNAKEAQLAVLWALVSSRDNYDVLMEMVTQSAPGFPYFLRLGYNNKSNNVSSFDDRQVFALGNVGGSAAWKAGMPKLWEEGKENQTFNQAETEQRKLRPKTGLFSSKRFLEGRSLRRRMFCDFTTTLAEYLSERQSRPWYRKYLQFNNIDSPARTAGLLECTSSNPAQYLDENFTPLTSYGANATRCTGGLTAFKFANNMDPEGEVASLNAIELASGAWADDTSRAWLQASGDHWPVLTATTLYDRHAWIPMPDGKVTITFREAMFLVLDEARVEVPAGVLGSDDIAPTTDVGNRHAGANYIKQYSPSFLLYLYQTLPALLKDDFLSGVRTMYVRKFVLAERLRSAFVTPYFAKTDRTFNAHDPVRYALHPGLLRQTVVSGEIGEGYLGEFAKNEREVVIRTTLNGTIVTTIGKLNSAELSDYVKYYTQILNSFGTKIAINPAQKSWLYYPIVGGLSAYAMDIEPVGKKVDSRYLSAPPTECALQTPPKSAPPPPQLPSIPDLENAKKYVVSELQRISSTLVFPC